MKILTSAQIHELDKYTIEHEPIASIDLMERAARVLTEAIASEYGTAMPVVVFAGPGNNGGDALAVARMLAQRGYGVRAYLFNIHAHLSADCAANRERRAEVGGVELTEVTTDFDAPKLDEHTLVIDGLFGSGINKPLGGGFASLVRYINAQPGTVVSIDMPSGLMPEDNSGNTGKSIVCADLTLTLHQRKLAMLFADTQRFTGRVRVLGIGLSEEYDGAAASPYSMVEETEVRRLIKPRADFVNKGTMGHALLMAGSYGMAGAAVLAARACLRLGAGKVSVHTARRNNDIMQISVPEAVVHPDSDDVRVFDAVDTEQYDALGVGPGLGTNEDTALALIGTLQRLRCNAVIDADAINILGSHPAWIRQITGGVVFTPHPREFDRLIGTACSSDYERLARAVEFAQAHDSYVLLKGHYSALCMPDGTVTFNTTGNSGMATAGSGDVLTGIITALLARGYSRHDAALVGMYLHGLAGDIAAADKGKESLVAGDIIHCLPAAFRRLSD